MKFRLNAQHYADDKLLEAGAIVGDSEDAVHPWRYPADIQTDKQNIKAGQAMPPSKEMTPLDDEAKKLYADTFPDERPKPATAPITPKAIQGKDNVGVPRPMPTKPLVSPGAHQASEPKKG